MICKILGSWKLSIQYTLPDVVSLFSRVPTALVVRVALDCLKADPSLTEGTTLSPAEVTSLLTFHLDATYLSYRVNWYQQTFGTAMGSPVSATDANLVMEDIEERALATCPLQPLMKAAVGCQNV